MSTPTQKATSFKTRGTIVHWVTALAFIWALLGPFGLRYIIGWSKWIAVYFYPTVCVFSGIFLLAKKKREVSRSAW
jgi:hypothetical protein